MIFQDREHAGQMLAQKLQRYKDDQSVLVLALPRGGVPVAAEVAKYLGSPLEVLIVRKIGAPFQAELAVGAMCEDSEPMWNDSILSRLGLEPDSFGQTVSAERDKIKRQTQMFRQARPFPSIAHKTVIVVDDGLATGSTMRAAIKFLKRKSVKKIVVAVPIAANHSISKFQKKVDEVVVVDKPDDLKSVSHWYRDFPQVTDEEVLALLQGPGISKDSPMVTLTSVEDLKPL